MTGGFIMKKFRAGIAQFDVRVGDVEANVSSAMKGISELADKGSELVVLPEMWSCGFDNENLVSHSFQTADILDELKQTAKEKKLVVAGSMPEFDAGHVFNTLYVIDNTGQLAGSYRKIHLFTPTDEHLYFGKGDTPVVCRTALGDFGLMICYDLRFPELGRALVDRGAELIIVCAQWPKIRKEHWDVLIRGRAVENQVYMIASNRCGSDPALEFAGSSKIVTPWGDVLANAGGVSGLVVSDVEPEEVSRARRTIPCLQERQPELFR